MRIFISFFLVIFLVQSCIPIRIAPNIKDYKVTKGKRFKRTLSKRQMFLFEDPKEAGDFYDFVNAKFQLNDILVDEDVPFMIEQKQYFFAFYEVEIPDKNINLIPLALDALLLESNSEPMFVNHYDSRKSNWYIAIEVYSDFEEDCLSEQSLSRDMVLKYLRALKNQYLSTENYNETVFTDKRLFRLWRKV